MYRVVDGVIVERELPLININKDGSQTIGYSLLPRDKLISDGWVDVKRIIPEYDVKTHYVVVDREDVKEDYVEVIYVLRTIEESIDRLTKLEIENSQLFDTIKYLLGIKL